MAPFKNFQKTVQGLLDSHSIIGGQFYISHMGAVICDQAVGLARENVPMRTDTIMPWMSMTKSVISVAVAQLCETGLLDVESAASRYLPEFGVNGKENITIRHLLTHTACIPTIETGFPEVSFEESLRRVCEASLAKFCVIGESAFYHVASSWFVLAEIIRRVSGNTAWDYLQERLFHPLGMNRCFLRMTPEEVLMYQDDFGFLYNTERSEIKINDWPTNNPSLYQARCNPGSSCRGPARELGLFYEMLLRGGESHGIRVLKPETISFFTSRHREGKWDGIFQHIIDWGFGFIIDSKKYGMETVPYNYGRYCSEKTFGHSGIQSSVAFADPANQLVVVMILNGTCGELRHHRRVRDLCSAVYEDLNLVKRYAGRT